MLGLSRPQVVGLFFLAVGSSARPRSEIRARIRKRGKGKIVGDLLALVLPFVMLAGLLDRR